MNYYNEIKNELVNNEIYKKVKDYSKNINDLKTYYNVGKLLSKAGKSYGDGIIKKYSQRLTEELGKGYTTTNLKYMRQFYYFIEKGHAMRDDLSWTHYRELLKLDDFNKVNYYIMVSSNNNLSYRQFHNKIKNNEYEILSDKTKLKLINKEKTDIGDLIKNPILIKNKYNKIYISEKMLHEMILEDIPGFLKELGDDFSFIDSEYKIKIGDRYNYIDMLLFNIEFNSYVVELKITELKKEYIGQIKMYMNYIDKNKRKLNQGKTIGIIFCKKNN